jgi:hypothetical protein
MHMSQVSIALVHPPAPLKKIDILPACDVDFIGLSLSKDL